MKLVLIVVQTPLYSCEVCRGAYTIRPDNSVEQKHGVFSFCFYEIYYGHMFILEVVDNTLNLWMKQEYYLRIFL